MGDVQPAAAPVVTARGPVAGVRLLGPVAVSGADGMAFELPSPTQRRLLALLALQPGRVVRTDVLADVLGLAGGPLRKVVSRLRAVVGDALQTSAIGYQLDLDVDAERFADVVLGPRDAGDRIGRLETALGWWHGDALEEFAAEPWAIAAAVRLESLRAAAIEELAERWIEARRPADAIALLESHAARHPLADAPAALLLRALASAGRRTEALRVAHRYRTELRRTAGLEPGGELREIERRVADGTVGPSGRHHRPASLLAHLRFPPPPPGGSDRVGCSTGSSPISRRIGW